MTVRELQKILADLPPDMPVYIPDTVWGNAETSLASALTYPKMWREDRDGPLPERLLLR